MDDTKSQIENSNIQPMKNIGIKIEKIGQLKNHIDGILSTYKLLFEEMLEIKNLIEQYNDSVDEKNEENNEKVEKYIEGLTNKLDEIIKKDKKSLNIIEKYKLILEGNNDNNDNNIMASDNNSIQEEEVNQFYLSNYDKENSKVNISLHESKIGTPSKTTEVSTKSKKEDDEENIKIRKFRKDFNAVINSLKFKKKTLLDLTDISNFPYLDDYYNDEKLIKFIRDVCDLELQNKINRKNIKRKKDTIIESIHDNIPDLEASDDEYKCDEYGEVYESYIIDGINVEEIKNKLFYFINVISQDSNITYNIDELNALSKNIFESLNIQEKNLFLLQNSQIDNFVKCNNFNEIPLRQFKRNPLLTKFSELNSIKMNLLIAKYGINEKCFDNRGNFLNPNSRKIIFRGNELYEPPYGWMGLGLNVFGIYEDDIWLKDITNKSEWAIAYRGIVSKDVNEMKDYLKYFIENKTLKIASIELKEGIKNKRKSKNISKGVYMTPHIKIAEKYTQSISFNNKKYKVLLMAKVKAQDIIEPEDSNFWILDDENIRIYRVLFKEINKNYF